MSAQPITVDFDGKGPVYLVDMPSDQGDQGEHWREDEQPEETEADALLKLSKAVKKIRAIIKTCAKKPDELRDSEFVAACAEVRRQSLAVWLALRKRLVDALPKGAKISDIEAEMRRLEKPQQKRDGGAKILTLVPPERSKSQGEDLLMDRFGKPISCASNCKRWIARTGRKLEKNDFTNELSIDRKPVSDAAVVKLLIDMQQSTSVNIRKEHLMDGIIAICDENHYHPVREYLESCQWDGVERLDVMLDMVFGHQGQPYSGIMGRYWMISAVARIMGPGAKADYSLLLIGHKEGTGKSSFGEALVPDLKWFTDDVGGDLHSREAETGLFGKWIVEFPEGMRVDRAGKETFKGFMTRKTGRVTLKYERFAADFDRQCVFYITVNNPTPLDGFDEDRRQWPVSVNVAVDNQWIRDNRDQLWGEALVRFRRGEQYWLDRDLIEKIKREVHGRYEHTDALMDLVAQYVNTVPEPIFMGHIMESLKVSSDKPKAIQMRIANCLRALGFEKGKMIKSGPDRDKIPWERGG